MGGFRGEDAVARVPQDERAEPEAALQIAEDLVQGRPIPQLLDKRLQRVQLLARAAGGLAPSRPPLPKRGGDQPASSQREKGHHVLRLADGQGEIRLREEEVEAHRRYDGRRQRGGPAAQLRHDDREGRNTKARFDAAVSARSGISAIPSAMAPMPPATSHTSDSSARLMSRPPPRSGPWVRD